MKIDPSQLEMLAAIVEAGGLTEGAAMMGKSQPALSRSMAALEQRLGAALFVAGKRPLQPTELGLRLAEEGRRILQAGAAASQMVQNWRAGRSGAVLVGGTPVFMDGVIVAMLAAFQMQNPDVRIAQSYGYAPDLTANLLAGNLDLAICPLRADDRDARLTFDPLLPGRNVIAARDGHPLAHARSLTAADLMRFPWLAPPENSPLYTDLVQIISTISDTKIRVAYSGGSISAVMEVLMGSDALTVLPYSVVFAQRRQFGVVPLAVKIDHPDRTLGLMHPKEATLSPAARRLRGFILTQFETLSATIQHHERNAIWRR
jgi:DNA-binding transcriptional LysR family regulator